jgi:hypothetical protein
MLLPHPFPMKEIRVDTLSLSRPPLFLMPFLTDLPPFFALFSLPPSRYTAVTDWTGGLYISPGVAGSRPGALIATAWASLVRMGREGFLEVTRTLMAAARDFAQGVAGIEGLEVVGEPAMVSHVLCFFF